MVRTVLGVLFVLCVAIPALAQEDYPKIQTSMGYANISFPDLTTLQSSRHSGFANETGFNLTKIWGLNNYMGIYSLGQGVTMIADSFGGKATYRFPKFAPYAVAGIGIGYLTNSYSFASSSFASRVGAGFDIPFNDTMAWKFEVSRFGFHIATSPNSSWTNSTNFSTGIVFTLAQ